METVRGTAQENKSTVSISGGGENSSVQTTHISIFKIDGRTVKMPSHKPPIIDNGDEVVVAGRVKDGLFEGLAYKNISQGIIGYAYPPLLLMILGVVFVVMPSFVASVFIFSPFGANYFPAILALVFIGVGLYCFKKGMNIKKAKGIVCSTI